MKLFSDGSEDSGFIRFHSYTILKTIRLMTLPKRQFVHYLYLRNYLYHKKRPCDAYRALFILILSQGVSQKCSLFGDICCTCSVLLSSNLRFSEIWNEKLKHWEFSHQLFFLISILQRCWT